MSPLTEDLDGLALHALHPHWAMGEIGPLLIVIWRGNVTEEALRQINERVWNLTQQRPGACAYINVIERNSPPPSAPLRKIAMEGLSKPGKALTCLGAVFEGNEFRSALVRAVMTGMALLRPQGQPTKFFKNTQEMAVWVSGQLRNAGVDVNANDIGRACEHIRSKMPT
jgi:hypothetical protein